MRHRVLQCAAMLLVVVAGVSGDADTNLDMPAPAVAAVGRDGVLAQCGPEARIGCTNFRDYMLTCHCVRTNDGWRVDALASAVPQVYLTSFNYLSHEMLHIADFRHMLRGHVKAIETGVFPSKASCDRYATALVNAFPETMRRIARISTGLRDGARGVDTSEDHFIVMQAKVVPQLMNDGVADLAHRIAPVTSNSQDWTAEDGDLVRQ
jgi:hypothetical protein